MKVPGIVGKLSTIKHYVIPYSASWSFTTYLDYGTTGRGTSETSMGKV